MKTPLRPARAALSAALLTALLTGAAAAPALADGSGAPTAGTQAALAQQYSSLSGALLNLYATQSHQSLSQYLASQQVLLSPPDLPDPVPAAGASGSPTTLPTDPATPGAATPGAATPATPALATAPLLGTAAALGAQAGSAKPVTAATLGELNTQLAGAGLTLDTKGYTSLDALARGVVAKSGTVDGTVTLAGARWMSQLATLHTPALSTPGVATPAVPGLPKSALVFGLFADKSLTSLVNSSPNLFATAGRSGLGSAALSSAWNASMLKVYNASSGDFSKLLPDPCTGGMLAVMATGNAASATKVSGSGCSPACVTGGLYLHSQTDSMFAPGAATTFSNPYSSVWNSTTLNGLQRWQQEQLLEQNPALANQLLADNKPSASAACTAASQATGGALGATLPGVFSQLRTR